MTALPALAPANGPVVCVAAADDAPTDALDGAALLELDVSVVSHDLRNPVGVAQGHLGMVRERTDHDSLD